MLSDLQSETDSAHVNHWTAIVVNNKVALTHYRVLGSTLTGWSMEFFIIMDFNQLLQYLMYGPDQRHLSSWLELEDEPFLGPWTVFSQSW